MKKALLVAIIGVFAVSVNAGDWGKAPVQDKTPIAGCPDTSGSVTVAYATDYLIHGLRANRDSVWLDANYTFESVVPVTLGVSHFAGINGFLLGAATPIDETDVYLNAAVASVGGFDVTLGYRQRFFNSNFLGSMGEISLGLSRDLGFATLSVGSDYVLNTLFANGNGWFHHAGLEKAVSLTDSVSLVLTTGVGYHDGAFVNSSGWSHYYVGAALPIQLNCAATLTPYIGYNGVQQWSEFNGQGDLLHAGISLNVKF